MKDEIIPSLSCGTPLCGQFHLPGHKADICSLITPLNTDAGSGHFSVSQVTNFHIALTPLYRDFLLRTAYNNTSKNLTETASDLQKVLSNLQSTWLSRKLKASEHKVKSWIPFSCFKNNTFKSDFSVRP